MSTENSSQANVNDEAELNANTLVQGIEDIQNHALQQHELHLDAGVNLRILEGKIEKTFQALKQCRIENMECENTLYGMQCQGNELKQMIARESALLLSAEEKRDAVQRSIDTAKSQYLSRVEQHEAKMAKLSEKFRSAPERYKRENLVKVIKKDTQVLTALEAKRCDMEHEQEKLKTDIKSLENDDELEKLTMLVEEMQCKIDSNKKSTKTLKKQKKEAKENLCLQLDLKKKLLVQLDKNAKI